MEEYEGPAVRLAGASKSYGKVRALEGADFEARPGEVVALLGPNGAGKTTAISLMLGLKRPTSGEATLFGGDPRDPASRLRVGAMLQESGVPQTLKVYEITELFRRLYERPMKTREALERAQLSHKVASKVGDLSGGERQRLYFALAVVGDPDLLFLDEPTVGMDVESRRRFWAQVEEMHERGKTIVLTTHYLEEADALAGRIVVIDDGRIIAEGSPQEIKRRVGGRRVRFTSPDDLPYLPELPGVERVSCEGDAYEVLTLEPEETLKALFTRGAPVGDLEVSGAKLEEAFVALTSTGSG